MNETAEYSQDAKPVRSRRVLKVVLASIAGAAIATAAIWGGIAYVSNINTQRDHLAAVAFQHAAELAMPRLIAQSSTAADEADTTSADEAVAAEQTREAAALAEQQAAAQAAYAAQHNTVKKCPAGSVAGSVDDNGNESNCRGENGNGEVCQAYDDANNCTAWGKP